MWVDILWNHEHVKNGYSLGPNCGVMTTFVGFSPKNVNRLNTFNVHIWIIMCNAIAAYDVRWNRFAVISECARRCCSHSPHSFTDFCVLHTFDFSDTAASVEETRSNEQMRAMVIGEEGEKEVWQKTQMRARQEDFVIISISSTAYKK